MDREIWFSGRKKTNHIGVVELHAVTLSGKERLVAQNPQLMIVEDIAPDGRVLARSDDWPETMMCLPPGATREVNLTWLDFSQGVALSADGQDLLFIEGGAGAGATGGVYMRKTDGSTAAVRLGDGWTDRQDLSPDKKWIVQAQPDRLTLRSGRAGGAEDDPGQGFPVPPGAVVPGRQAPARRGGDPGPRAADVRARPGAGTAPADHARRHGEQRGSRATGRASSSATSRHGSGRCIPWTEGRPPPSGVREDEEVLGFDDKGQNLYVASQGLSKKIDRLDLATGKRTFFKEVTPADPTGVGSIVSIQLTPDGKSYCYSFMRALSRLYVVDGLR